MTEKHLSKHRHASAPRRRTSAKRVAVTAAVAVLGTGLAVSGGLLAGSSPLDGSASATSATSLSGGTTLTHADLADREQRVSRSEDRTPLTRTAKATSLTATTGPAKRGTVDLSSADPKSLTKALMPQFGFSPSDFSCVDSIWSNESGWNVHAANPTSSAYGIPQALPGSKMSSAGPDWQNNPETQIKWGLGYLKSRYGSPCAAWGYKQSHGWY